MSSVCTHARFCIKYYLEGPQRRRSDEWGWKALDPIWCYDLHATLLHLLGIDHEQLTVRHNGIDRRLTDVHGHLLPGLLA